MDLLSTHSLSSLSWEDWRKVNDFTWYYYSLFLLLGPMNVLWFYKLWNPIDYSILSDPKRPFKRHLVDRYLALASWYSIFYYIVDAFLCVLTGNIYNKCGLSFFIHHIVSIIFLPSVCNLKHWPWFWVGPGAMHAWLLALPDETWMNYIYIVVIFIFQYGVYLKPWTDIPQCRRMKVGIFAIECACFLLWIFDCKNTLI